MGKYRQRLKEILLFLIDFCYFIKERTNLGNSDNDESVHDTGVKTICVNPAQTDRYNTEIWNDYISAKSANDLMKFIDD